MKSWVWAKIQYSRCHYRANVHPDNQTAHTAKREALTGIGQAGNAVFARPLSGVGGWKDLAQSLLSPQGNQRYWHLDFGLSGRRVLSFRSRIGQHSVTAALQNQEPHPFSNCERPAETLWNYLSAQSLGNESLCRKGSLLTTEKE